MKCTKHVVWAALVFASGAGACATDDMEVGSPGALAPDSGDDGHDLPDGGILSERDAPSGPSACSSAGWCTTSLPDEDLVLKNVWPLENRAFVTAESPTLGIKILEWDSTGTWRYIDDNSQNQTGLARYVSTIWARDDNEIFYAVAKGTIVHGTRPNVESPWTWESSALEDELPVHKNHPSPHDYPVDNLSGAPIATLGVWGTPDGEVYAWYVDTIYHWMPLEDGTVGWQSEYRADDTFVDDANRIFDELFVVGATGSGRDDLWFTFARTDWNGVCPVIVRKTAAGYARVFDGVVGGSRCKEARPGSSMLTTERGWLQELESTGPGRVAGIVGGRQLVHITTDGAGYSVSTAPIMDLPPVTDIDYHLTPFLAGLYPTTDGLWMSGTGLPGVGVAVHVDEGADPDAGYRISTLSTTGAPLQGTLFQIRGTSNTNLWLVGAHHALHKTTL